MGGVVSGGRNEEQRRERMREMDKSVSKERKRHEINNEK